MASTVSERRSGEESRVPIPSFDDPDADVILRSLDHVNFRVRKAVLSEYSSFFKEMFTLPLADDSPQLEGLDVVPMPEDQKELYLFLRLCYPDTDHSLSGLSEVKRALKIMRKYDVQRIPDSVGLALMFAVDEHPTTVCAIACGYNFPSIANAAAKASLKKPLLSDAPPSEDDFDLMTPSQYDRLLRYHKRVASSVHAVISSDNWMHNHTLVPTAFSFPTKADCPQTFITVGKPPMWGTRIADWVLQYKRDIADALAVTPDFNTVSRRGIATMRATMTAIASGCAHCREELEKLPSFAEYIAEEVERTTSAIPLPF